MLEHSPLPLRDQLIALCSVYAEAKKISLSTLSTQLLNGGGRLQTIATGGDLNTGSFEQAMAWLSDNWPAGIEWPSDIKRPTPQEASAA